jgi:hypothetical protein
MLMNCEQCKKEFSRENYPVTLSCGHNYCKSCIKRENHKNFVCKIDEIKQDVVDKVSIDFMNLIEYIRGNREVSFSLVEGDIGERNGEGPRYEARVPVCRFYLQGNCRYGSRCWNRHSIR